MNSNAIDVLCTFFSNKIRGHAWQSTLNVVTYQPDKTIQMDDL
jgi:hypothetical protein